MIPLEECVYRGVYRVHSRNLNVAVFDGKTGFIGIREKFGSRFLDTEYHREVGAGNFGTLSPIELLVVLPDGIEAWEDYPGSIEGRSGSWDSITGREVSFDQERRKRAEETGVGWGWYFVATGEDDPERKIRSHGRSYRPLFDFLNSITTESEDG